MKFPLGKIIARFNLRERSNKKRLDTTVCDEIMEKGFHGCTQKTIISLEISVRPVPIFGAGKFSRFSRSVSKKKC